MSEPQTMEYERFQLASGQSLFEYGDDSEAVYLLSNGSVDLRHQGSTLSTVDNRDHPIGAAGVVLNVPRQYTAVAAEDSTFKRYPLDQDAFFKWLDNRPLLLVDIMKNYVRLVDHFNEANEGLFELFRTYRTLVQNLIRPLSRINSILRQLKQQPHEHPPDRLVDVTADSPFEPLLESYRQIVNTTGRSNEADFSDLDVPDETIEEVEPGGVICSEGEVGDNLYVLIEGTLSVFKGDQRVAVIDQHGSVFGEMSPALSDKRRATVQADTTAVVSIVPYDQLESLLNDSPEFSHKLVNIFVKRYQRAVRLNHQLHRFLGYVKTLLSGKDLPASVREYLEDLGDAIRESHIEDEDLRKASDEFLQWMVNEDGNITDRLPPEPLEEFNSKDMSY